MSVDWSTIRSLSEGRSQFIEDQSFRKLFRSVTNLHSRERVLDVGCGVGDVAHFFDTIHGDAVEIYGIDSDEALIKHGKEKFGRPAHIHLEVGDATDLQFENSKFDLVISFGLLEWLYAAGIADRGISEMVRVVRLGGRIIAISMEVSKYETLPRHEKRDEFFQNYVEGLGAQGCPNKEEGQFIQQLLSQNGVETKRHDHVFETRQPITDERVDMWEHPTPDEGGFLFGPAPADFYFQFYEALGWTRKQFDAMLNKEFSKNRMIAFLRKHVGEDAISRRPLVILESKPIRK